MKKWMVDFKKNIDANLSVLERQAKQVNDAVALRYGKRLDLGEVLASLALDWKCGKNRFPTAAECEAMMVSGDLGEPDAKYWRMFPHTCELLDSIGWRTT